MRIETVTFEYEHCGECPHPGFLVADFDPRCRLAKHGRGNRIIKDLWGEIPDWCPLEKK